MAEAAGIFIGHAHGDNAWCRTFVETLASVWYDEHNLGYGVLGDEIEKELRARPIFIVIRSPASVGKPWVRRETDAAISLRDEIQNGSSCRWGRRPPQRPLSGVMA
jgi:hypothetical protein